MSRHSSRIDGLETGRKLVHRSEEHTSELQSQSNLVCRLLLEKKKRNRIAEGRIIEAIGNTSRRPTRVIVLLDRSDAYMSPTGRRAWAADALSVSYVDYKSRV